MKMDGSQVKTVFFFGLWSFCKLIDGINPSIGRTHKFTNHHHRGTKGREGGGEGAILATILDFIKNQKSGLNRKKW